MNAKTTVQILFFGFFVFILIVILQVVDVQAIVGDVDVSGVVDDSGNPVGEYVWHDDQVKYSSTQDDPVHPSWHIAINTLAPDWSQAAIRIFYTIGQYDESEELNFRNWNPPADLGLVGSGSPSGADRQVITWML